MCNIVTICESCQNKNIKRTKRSTLGVLEKNSGRQWSGRPRERKKKWEWASRITNRAKVVEFAEINGKSDEIARHKTRSNISLRRYLSCSASLAHRFVNIVLFQMHISFGCFIVPAIASILSISTGFFCVRICSGFRNNLFEAIFRSSIAPKLNLYLLCSLAWVGMSRTMSHRQLDYSHLYCSSIFYPFHVFYSIFHDSLALVTC